jgi:hypothetical protein
MAFVFVMTTTFAGIAEDLGSAICGFLRDGGNEERTVRPDVPTWGPKPLFRHRAAARQFGVHVWKARLMPESTEDNPRYSVQPGQAEEIELLPGMDTVAYRLDGDHFVKVHIVAPIGVLGSLPPISSFGGYGYSGAADVVRRPSVFDRAALDQVVSHISGKWGASGVASYRPGHEYIDLAIKCHPAVQPFSIEFDAPAQALRSSGDEAVDSSGSMD